MDQPRGAPRGSRLPEPTQRAILMLKRRIRSGAASGSATSCCAARATAPVPARLRMCCTRPATSSRRSRPRRIRPRCSTSSGPGPISSGRPTCSPSSSSGRTGASTWWPSSDDHSRFIVGYGLHASRSAPWCWRCWAAIAGFGAPEEVLTDNGTQYVTWRGKSAFAKLLEARHPAGGGVAAPAADAGQDRALLGHAVAGVRRGGGVSDLDDARRRIGLFIDHYNFQRPHQGIDGLVPADRFFAAAPQVRETLQARVAANAQDLAVQGTPRKSFYLTGRVGDTDLALHSEGSRVVLTRSDGAREEVNLEATGRRMHDSSRR